METVQDPFDDQMAEWAQSVKTRHREPRASSAVLAVADEDVYRLVCQRGLLLQGRCYEVESYEEFRPDVASGHCSGRPHRGTVTPSRRAMRMVRGGTQDEELPMPYGGVLGQDGSLVSARRGKVRKLQGPPLCAGKRLPREEDGPQRREGVEAASPTWRQRGKTSQPEEPPTGTQETKGGKPEV